MNPPNRRLMLTAFAGLAIVLLLLRMANFVRHVSNRKGAHSEQNTQRPFPADSARGFWETASVTELLIFFA